MLYTTLLQKLNTVFFKIYFVRFLFVKCIKSYLYGFLHQINIIKLFISDARHGLHVSWFSLVLFCSMLRTVTPVDSVIDN